MRNLLPEPEPLKKRAVIFEYFCFSTAQITQVYEEAIFPLKHFFQVLDCWSDKPSIFKTSPFVLCLNIFLTDIYNMLQEFVIDIIGGYIDNFIFIVAAQGQYMLVQAICTKLLS